MGLHKRQTANYDLSYVFNKQPTNIIEETKHEEVEETKHEDNIYEIEHEPFNCESSEESEDELTPFDYRVLSILELPKVVKYCNKSIKNYKHVIKYILSEYEKLCMEEQGFTVITMATMKYKKIYDSDETTMTMIRNINLTDKEKTLSLKSFTEFYVNSLRGARKHIKEINDKYVDEDEIPINPVSQSSYKPISSEFIVNNTYKYSDYYKIDKDFGKSLNVYSLNYLRNVLYCLDKNKGEWIIRDFDNDGIVEYRRNNKIRDLFTRKVRLLKQNPGSPDDYIPVLLQDIIVDDDYYKYFVINNVVSEPFNCLLSKEEHYNKYRKNGILNTFDNPTLKAYDPELEINEDIIKQFTDFLLEIVCDNNKELYEYTLEWIVRKILQPETKNETSLLFKSTAKGTGKGTISRIIMELCGSYFITTPTDLTNNRFNAKMEGKPIGFMDELSGTYKIDNHSKLKEVITQTDMLIERKYGEPYITKSYCDFIATTNEELPIKIDSDDRRWVIYDFNPKRQSDFNYWDTIYKFTNKSNDEFKHLYNWFIKRGINSNVNIRVIPMTESKKELILESKSPFESFIDYIDESIDDEIDDYEFEQTYEFKRSELERMNKDRLYRIFISFHDNNYTYKNSIKAMTFKRRMGKIFPTIQHTDKKRYFNLTEKL